VFRQLGPDPLEDPMRRMALLTRRIAVGLQDGIDEGTQRPDYRPCPVDLLTFRRFGTRQRLAHHAAMHS
jgi:hypothetical protein